MTSSQTCRTQKNTFACLPNLISSVHLILVVRNSVKSLHVSVLVENALEVRSSTERYTTAFCALSLTGFISLNSIWCVSIRQRERDTIYCKKTKNEWKKSALVCSPPSFHRCACVGCVSFTNIITWTQCHSTDQFLHIFNDERNQSYVITSTCKRQLVINSKTINGMHFGSIMFWFLQSHKIHLQFASSSNGSIVVAIFYPPWAFFGHFVSILHFIPLYECFKQIGPTTSPTRWPDASCTASAMFSIIILIKCILYAITPAIDFFRQLCVPPTYQSITADVNAQIDFN